MNRIYTHKHEQSILKLSLIKKNLIKLYVIANVGNGICGVASPSHGVQCDAAGLIHHAVQQREADPHRGVTHEDHLPLVQDVPVAGDPVLRDIIDICSRGNGNDQIQKNADSDEYFGTHILS